MAPFAPLFGPATFSPNHAPASLPSILKTPVRRLPVRRAGAGECSQEPLHHSAAPNGPPPREISGRMVGKSHQILVGEISRFEAFSNVFAGFPGLARSMNSSCHRSRSDQPTDQKRETFEISPSYRTLVAMAAALLTSAVTVGA